MSEMIRVLIVDDHSVIRLGLQMLLDTEDHICVVGEAANGEEALRMVERESPDVVIMDIAMPHMDGLEATRIIKRDWPSVKILALTMHRHNEYFFNMLQAGVSGYLYKGQEASDLIPAIQTVHQGDTYLPGALTTELVNQYLTLSQDNHSNGHNLTDREREIISLMAEGYAPNTIADKLYISASTVYTHYRNVMKKLELDTRQQLIQYARQHNL